MRCAAHYSDTNDLRLDDDVKLFFVVSNAIFDASIAAWDSKYHYDYVRPITAIRALGNALVTTWRPRTLTAALAYSTPLAAADAAKNPDAVPAGAADWEPYLPTPSFPSYVSGHSAFTAAWARAMELATGKPILAASPARSIILATPALLNGPPRSLTKM